MARGATVAAATNPGPWMLRALWTGNTPDLSDERQLVLRLKFRRVGRKFGRKGQEDELQSMRERYEARKASATDNVTKTLSVVTVLAALVAVVGAAFLTRNVLVAALGLLGVLPMVLAIILSNWVFAPKLKNWATNDVGCQAERGLDAILGDDPLASDKTDQAEIAALTGEDPYNGIDLQLEYYYLDAATNYHHWDQLVLLERRVSGVVVWLSNGGLALACLALGVAMVFMSVLP